MSKARDIADLDFNAPDIDGGNIDGAVIGATTAAASTFTDVVAASLDISGNIDVDGTTNLDVVDIDGAVDMASTLTVGDNILLEASGNPSITNKATGGGNNPTFRLQADTNYWDFQGTFSNTNDDLFFMYNGASKFSLTNAGAATFSSRVSATGSANSGSASHIPALLGSGSYGGGIATRDGAESGWYQQTSGADWHFYHNRTVASQTPESKKVLSFNSSGAATFSSTIAATGATLATASSTSLSITGGTGNSKNIYFNGDSSAQKGRIASIGTSLYFQLTDATSYFTINPGSTVINDSGIDHDFRVESDAHTHMLFVDGGTNMLGIDTSAPDYLLDVGNSSSSPAGGQVMRINSNGDTIFSLSKAGTSLFSMRNNSTSYTALSSNSGADLLLGYSASGAGAISDHLRFKSSETVFNEGSADRDFRVESNGNPHALYLDAGNEVLLIGNNARNNAFVDNVYVGLQIGNPGVDNFGGHMFMSQTAPQNQWKDIIGVHDKNATGVYFTIQGVRTGDQNRSYAATVRYAYSQTFTIMTVSQQNTTVEYRVTSGHVLQYRFTTAGPYFVNLTVMAAG